MSAVDNRQEGCTILDSNPFAELTDFLSPLFMQIYIILMIVLLASGTLIDVRHKHSGQFYLQNWKRKKAAETHPLNGLNNAKLAIRTLLKEALTSDEVRN